MGWNITEYSTDPPYSGALYGTDAGIAAGYAGGNSILRGAALNFDASRSNSIYNSSDEVISLSLSTKFIIRY